MYGRLRFWGCRGEWIEGFGVEGCRVDGLMDLERLGLRFEGFRLCYLFITTFLTFSSASVS